MVTSPIKMVLCQKQIVRGKTPDRIKLPKGKKVKEISDTGST